MFLPTPTCVRRSGGHGNAAMQPKNTKMNEQCRSLPARASTLRCCQSWQDRHVPIRAYTCSLPVHERCAAARCHKTMRSARACCVKVTCPSTWHRASQISGMCKPPQETDATRSKGGAPEAFGINSNVWLALRCQCEF